jgi:peptide/nickel transport system substrate-binding protein
MSGISRREFIRLSTLAAGSALLAACSAPTATQAPAPAEPTKAAEAPAAAPTATTAAAAAPAEPTATTAAAAPATKLKDVPRNQTVNLAWSISSPIGTTNGWASPGYTHQEGNAFLNEGLFYFGIFANKDIPWLAESMTYTKPDFTELTIKLRKEAMWSDGVPFTSKDVVFNCEGQKSNDKLAYNAFFAEFMKEAKAVDDQTVVLTFTEPAPRFKFEVLSLKFDTGIEMVPEHVLSQQADPNAFPGGLDMPHSGPYTNVIWDQNQKIFDLREDWWAVKAGLEPLPAVKRIVMSQIGGQVGQNMDVIAQRVVNNEFDATLDMRSAVIGNILKQNAKVTTHAGNKSPYGYLDWWPNSLWCNTQLAPYSDPNVRKAMSLTIDRDKIDEILYEGAKIANVYPFPLYPNLVKFTELPEMKALVEKYQPREFNVDKSGQLMTAAGFAKNGDGLWAKDGSTVNCVINGFEGIHSDIVPVLVEMLKNGGFDASVNFGTDASQNMADGKPGLYMFGHGASTVDPMAALDLYWGKYSVAAGTTAGNAHYSRYKNPEYDKIVEAMHPLGSDDPEFTKLAVQAMEWYWKDTIDIPVIQWLHRIPYNQTYWVNWPTVDNLAAGTNGAFWAHTGMLVISQLKPAA